MSRTFIGSNTLISEDDVTEFKLFQAKFRNDISLLCMHVLFQNNAVFGGLLQVHSIKREMKTMHCILKKKH